MQLSQLLGVPERSHNLDKFVIGKEEMRYVQAADTVNMSRTSHSYFAMVVVGKRCS